MQKCLYLLNQNDGVLVALALFTILFDMIEVFCQLKKRSTISIHWWGARQEEGRYVEGLGCVQARGASDLDQGGAQGYGEKWL